MTFGGAIPLKPHVICHMLGPLDGRLLVDPWAPEGSALRKPLLDEYQRLHVAFDAEAWLAGTTTMEDFATGVPSSVPSSAPSTRQPPARPWHLADVGAKRFAIAIDRSARLHWDKPTADEGHVVVVLSSSVPDSHLCELAASGVSYLVMGGAEIDLGDMLAQLHGRLAIKILLLEGGARINGAFLKAGLVDEISLLLCPAIDGTSGGAALFETGDSGVGTALALELRSVQAVSAGAVHLRYAVTATPAR